MALFLVSALPTRGFYRAGIFWPHAGLVTDQFDLSIADWDAIVAEPMLRVMPAPEGSIPVEPATVDEQVRLAFGGLATDAYDAKGRPRVDALRAALPALATVITAELRDRVWAAAGSTVGASAGVIVPGGAGEPELTATALTLPATPIV